MCTFTVVGDMFTLENITTITIPVPYNYITTYHYNINPKYTYKTMLTSNLNYGIIMVRG